MRFVPKDNTPTKIVVSSLAEGKGTVYNLIADSQKNLEAALKMAKKNKKMKPMVKQIMDALEAIGRID